MKKLMMVLSLLLVALSSFATTNVVSGRVLVKVSPEAASKVIASKGSETGISEIDALSKKIGAKTSLLMENFEKAEVAEELGLNRILVVDYDADLSVAQVIEMYSKINGVELAQADQKYELAYTTNDPMQEWYIDKIKAHEGWDIQKGATGVTIAIVDNGTTTTHEDIAPSLWVNSKETPNDGVDNDGNGKIDDVNGWDFSDNDKDPNPTNVTDQVHHGTATAGLAAAAGDNGKGIVGVGFGAKIMPLKVFPNATTGATAPAFKYAVENGAKVINASWGGYGSPDIILQDAITYANELGCVVVGGAGNEGKNVETNPFYPGAYPNVINVAATNSSDGKPSWSNYGVGVDVCAPGEGVYSTQNGSGYKSVSGTSFAAPQVAGAAAVLIAKYPVYGQSADGVKLLMDAISSTGDTPSDSRIGKRLNLQNALGVNPSVPYPSARFVSGKNLDGDAVLTWQAPLQKAFKNYKILRNGATIADNITALTYTDVKPTPATYTYSVVAVYDGGESMKKDVVVTVTAPAASYWLQAFASDATYDMNKAEGFAMNSYKKWASAIDFDLGTKTVILKKVQIAGHATILKPGDWKVVDRFVPPADADGTNADYEQSLDAAAPDATLKGTMNIPKTNTQFGTGIGEVSVTSSYELKGKIALTYLSYQQDNDPYVPRAKNGLASFAGTATETKHIHGNIEDPDRWFPFASWSGTAAKVVWLRLYVQPTGVGINDEMTLLPGSSELSQNYPNPFNPVTTISYKNNMGGKVALTVYNSKGELVETLVNKNQPAGNYSVTFDGSKLNSGVYYYTLTTETKTITNKMVLIK